MPVEIAVGPPLLGIDCMDVRFWREGERWTADVREGTASVQEEPCEPWRFDHEEVFR